LAETARASSGLDTPDANPAAAQKLASAIEQAGPQRPAGVPDSEIEELPLAGDTAVADSDALVGKPPAGLSPGEPAKDEAEGVSPSAAAAAVDEAAERTAAKDLAVATATAEESTASKNATNAQTAQSQEVVVAKIQAPQSIDADGKAVDTSLTADGDVITMHVDHQGKDVAYPIAADPEVVLVPTSWNIVWYAELAEETYVHHWAKAQQYVGNWHPVYCQWGWIQNCAGAGVPAWFRAFSGGLQHVAYWPSWNWGPAWQDYFYPVYATRWVVARWVPMWWPDLNKRRRADKRFGRR